jgi:hypothetical protein
MFLEIVVITVPSAARTDLFRKGDRAENAHLPTRRRNKIMKHRFKSARYLKRLVFIHDGVANLHNCPRHAMSSSEYRALRSGAMVDRREIAEPGIAAERPLKAPRLCMAAVRQVDSTEITAPQRISTLIPE